MGKAIKATGWGQYDIPVPTGVVVDTPEHARSVVSAIGAPSMLKSQILAGGRGKGKFDTDGKGGVRMVSTPDEAFENASQMLGHYLTTKQTPPKGLLVKKLYIYKAEDVAHEYYVAVTFDRQQSSPVLLISGEGGVNVESEADQLHRFWFSPSRGVTPDLIAAVRSRLLFSTAEMPIIERVIQQLVKLFVEKDAILLELNPLVLTPDGRFVCLDAKFDLDDAARFRQQGLYSLEEPTPDLAEEYEASRHGLVYIRLDGNIGNVVNGAGLAMATNDLINLHGGKSANFLDIGGKATGETLWQAVEMLNRDPHVQGMWINIFGGIVRCDMIAQSIVDAGSAMGGFRMPVVVRLQGTNSDEAQQIIQKSGMDLHTESDFELAAERIIELTPRCS
ncbi:succinyl-CoA synthetase beta chain [Aspergillus campestris IBT 28561]|uniref:Succinyl-CoA synthetase beta chain n=1 Tax=Aspergillus campestris (strain IBT 28561) TaxID=1392248 RepID=A0A2I1D8G5_ASPC2|nr:succinyl-CoA synthetase beta chain [Aspergillus campestris IBT 28561]PKY06165.1 succinyl-CoA synthetase beta chain [Aspergillus campestris IBT 28561]